MAKLTAIIDEATDFVEISVLQGKRTITKKLTLLSFVNLINDSVNKADGDGIHIGNMPNGYVDAKFFDNGFDVLLETKEGTYPYLYAGECFVIPYPKLLFFFKVRNEKLMESKCFAEGSRQDMLYSYPFSNVYENGNICWGSNAFNSFPNLESVNYLVQTFFSAPNNNDLWHPERCNGKALSIRQLLDDIKDKEKYPDEYLKACIKKELFNFK